MLGTILFVDEATGTGIIRADDGKRYRFPVTEWPADADLAAGVRVDFDTDGDRALAPVPINDAVVEAVTAAPLPTIEVTEVPEEPAEVASVMAVTSSEEPAMVEEPVAEQIARVPDAIADPVDVPPNVETATTSFAPSNEVEELPPGRPLSVADDDVPAYVGLTEPDPKAGRTSGIFVVGGAILLLALGGLAYMMWDNAETAGVAELAAEESGESVSLFAQEDLPVRNVASMTNATVLGRIARSDRVTGVEVPGSADPQSRWLRIDGGNRFVPMTGLGQSAPPALAAAPVVPVPTIPPTLPDDNSLERQFGGQAGDYRADRNGPIDAVPPVPDRITPNRPAPPVRPAPPIRPTPPPQRPQPVRPRPQPDRQVQPSRPQDTRPVGPQQPGGPQRQGDPRETSPVG